MRELRHCRGKHHFQGAATVVVIGTAERVFFPSFPCEVNRFGVALISVTQEVLSVLGEVRGPV